MDIKKNLNKIKNGLPEYVKLVAVTKTHPVDIIQDLYNSGHNIYGENKAQELIEKAPLLPSDVEWHFIGHLQRNKVRAILPYVKVIHSIDSMRLLKEVQKEAKKINKTIDCLLQFHIASEKTKYGLLYEEATPMCEEYLAGKFSHVKLTGVMGMATLTNDKTLIKNEFSLLKQYFDKIKETYFANDSTFREISMGMSDDYLIAINSGSTIVRLGSILFGARNY